MKFNTDCYKLDIKNYTKGLFDDSVDMTYVITMKNATERHKTMLEQLDKFKPTKQVTIIYNDGYKNCKKYDNFDKLINTTYEDLSYTNLYIFHLAKRDNYNNILILEDDFIFSNKLLRRPTISSNINEFVNRKKPKVYYLGCAPWVSNIFSKKHIKLYISSMNHSVIFSKKARDNIISAYNKCNYKDIDYFTRNLDKKYMYKEPLSFQLLDETENRKQTDKVNKPFFLQEMFDTLFLKILYFFVGRLDRKKNIERKFNRLYYFCYAINVVMFITIMMFISVVIYKLYLLIKHKK